MAIALAKTAYFLGATVTFIGNVQDNFLPISYIKTSSVNELFNALNSVITAQKQQDKKPLLFMAAAVSDYAPKQISGEKIKKSVQGSTLNIELTQTIDILSSIDKSFMYTVGFKAETDAHNAYKNALEMLHNKAINAVCLNVLGDIAEFGSDQTKIQLITTNANDQTFIGEKLSVAHEIFAALENNF